MKPEPYVQAKPVTAMVMKCPRNLDYKSILKNLTECPRPRAQPFQNIPFLISPTARIPYLFVHVREALSHPTICV
jgi:hypothetical protein